MQKITIDDLLDKFIGRSFVRKTVFGCPNHRNKCDNETALTLLLYIYIYVLLVWKAFSFVIFSKVYFIIYNYKLYPSWAIF